MRPTRTQAIRQFLLASTHPDLASLYNHDMEVQVNVAQDGGERVDGDFKGRQWHGFTDGVQTWKAIRIPYKAMSNPEYIDKEISYDLAVHAEGIGMTGWDWVARASRWVAFDFDHMTGHSDKHVKKLTDQELEHLRDVLANIEWVTLRKSTGGKGLHVYVFLDPVQTENHTEHAALARAVLDKLSELAGYNFHNKVDICGGNMWVWHRKMRGTDGLSVLKSGTRLDVIPENWRDHVKVVSGRKAKSVPKYIEDQELAHPGVSDSFDELCGQRVRVTPDAEHKRFMEWHHTRYPSVGGWSPDHWMFTTHTAILAEAHEELALRGPFKTLATGRDKGSDHNCFSGSTEVLTEQGVFPIQQLAQLGRAKLYVRTNGGKMRWIECEVKSFGKQKTYPLRFGDRTQIRVTADHMWLFRENNQGPVSQDRKFTYELVPDKTQLPLAPVDLPEIDWEGYAHGFVYGDGWEVNTRGKLTTTVALFKNDIGLKELLLQYGELGSQVYNNERVDCVRQLPPNWKCLPKSPSKEYALGFVLGLACADGFVGTNLKIFQSDLLALDEVRRLAIYAGLRAYDCRLYADGSSGFENSRPSYALSINTYNLTAGHFLREDFAKNFSQREKCYYTTVSWIDWEQPVEEEVFCAVVPVWQNFTLANGVVTSNCFMYPMPGGAWAVRRYSLGVQEHPSWIQDGGGWTRCFYNRLPDFVTSCRMHDGLEDKGGGFCFGTIEQAERAAELMGVHLGLPNHMQSQPRRVRLTEDKKTGRIWVEVEGLSQVDRPEEFRGWLNKSGKWSRFFEAKTSESTEPEIVTYDDEVRHLITESGEDYGWVISSDGLWHSEPYHHVKMYLGSRGHKPQDVVNILGSSVARCWRMVNYPFEPEYPKDRCWNRGAAQLRHPPTQDRDKLEYGTWLKVLRHCGRGLDEAVARMPWAKANNILTGADYLKCWVASLFKAPREPLPYLFFYGSQDCGKSSFHEALELLVTNGVARADTALVSQSNFNGELEHAIICVVEETDLRKNTTAYNRIKDWVTSRMLPIHKKQKQPYTVPNTTHWIQCANSHLACPVFAGDTRITMCHVDDLDPEDVIPKRLLIPMLEREAPDFVAEILHLELPPSPSRLNIPVVSTEEKAAAELANQTFLEMFLSDHCHHVDGEMISYGDFYDRFVEWIDPNYLREWTKIKVGRELPPKYPKGRLPQTGQFFLGNISWEPRSPDAPTKRRLVLKDGKLVQS